jgi:hypothetical protein
VAARETSPDFLESRAVKGMPQLAEQVFGKRHAFQRGTRFQLAMPVGRYVANLNHHGHAISIFACKTHVKQTGTV